MIDVTVPSLGVFSPYTLMLHQDATGELPDTFFKRAAILFEKLVFFPLGLGSMGESGELISKEAYLRRWFRDTDRTPINDYLDLFLLDLDVIEDRESFMQQLYTLEQGDLWYGEAGEIFTEWVKKLIDRERAEAGEYREWAGDEREAFKYYVGNINADYKLLTLASRDLTDSSGLFSELHEAAVLAVHGMRTRTDQTVVKIVSDLNTVDFGALTWGDVFKLRSSGFVHEFRSKLLEWAEEYTDARDVADFEGGLNSFIDDAKFEIIGKSEPAIGKSILAGIAGAVPLPTPINPVGVAMSVVDAAKQRSLKKDYGWLFFIQRARALSREASDS